MDDSTQHDLRLARRGDRDAIARLLARHEATLRRFANARLGKALRAKVRASDVLQSAFLTALQGGFRGDTDDAFHRWASRIVENKIRDKGKFFTAQKRHGDKATPRISDLPSRAGPVATPSATLAKGEDADVVRDALANLPDDQRRILVLHVIEQRSHREAAALMRRTETAARSLLTRARAARALEIERQRARRKPPTAGRSGLGND